MYPTQIVPYRVNNYVNTFDNRRVVLYSYTERLSRIVEECLDVALNVCNNECEQFGMAKFFDVFNQVLPTAFVLNTGYWPFFHTVEGQCLCICGRFAMPCRHVKNSYHWLDLMPDIPTRDSPIFYPRSIGCVFPVDYNICVLPIEDRTCLGYRIKVDLKLQHKKSERGRPKRVDKQKRKSLDGKVDNKQIYNCFIIASYDLTTEFYPAYYSILFKPNPIFHEHYGVYFHQIRESRTKDPWISNNVQNYYPISIDMMPKNSLVIRSVNFPTYIVPPQVVAVSPFSPPNQIKFQRPRKNKATQSSPADEERQIQRLNESISKTRCIFDQQSSNINEGSEGASQDFRLPPIRTDYPTRFFHNTLSDVTFLDLPLAFNNNANINQFSLHQKIFPPLQPTEIKQEPRTEEDYPSNQPSTSFAIKQEEVERMPAPTYSSVVRSNHNINNNNKPIVNSVQSQTQTVDEEKVKEYEEDLDEMYSLLQEIIDEDLGNRSPKK